MSQGSFLSDACRSVRPVNWLLLGVPVLLLLLAMDKLLPDYEAAMSDNEDITVRLQRAQIQADMLPIYRSRLDDNQELHEQLLKKAFQTASAEQSADQLSKQISSIFASVYIQPDAPIQVTAQSAKMDVAGLEALISFNCVPQQLQALELQLLALSHLVKATYLDIRVAPDNLRGSQQLQVKLKLRAVHVSVAHQQAPTPTPKSTS
jgi:hypothetical protein